MPIQRGKTEIKFAEIKVLQLSHSFQCRIPLNARWRWRCWMQVEMNQSTWLVQAVMVSCGHIDKVWKSSSHRKLCLTFGCDGLFVC